MIKPKRHAKGGQKVRAANLVEAAKRESSSNFHKLKKWAVVTSKRCTRTKR